MSPDKAIWVWAECYNGVLEKAALGLLGKAREVAEKLGGAEVAALLAGTGSQEIIQNLMDCGADKVYVSEKPHLDVFQTESCAQFVAGLAETYRPEAVLWGATSLGSEVAARTAAKLNTGLTAHCIALEIENVEGVNQLVASVAGYGGNLIIRIVCPNMRPQMITAKSGVFPTPRPEQRHGEVVKVSTGAIVPELEVVEVVEEKEKEDALEKAEVVIAGGWGMNCFGDLGPAQELADLLGGGLGGTRPAVDAGWLPHERMIGQSGITVSPRLLVTLGVSGAAQFSTTVLGAQFILAIDRNPRAPIFDIADLGIVGDLQEVLPLLVEKIKQAQGV